MSRNIDTVIKQFKERATDNRTEEHYWKNRPNQNSNTLEYAQKACKSAEENEQIVAWLIELQERREAVKKLKETLENMPKRIKASLFGDGIRFALKVMDESRRRDSESEDKTNE